MCYAFQLSKASLGLRLFCSCRHSAPLSKRVRTAYLFLNWLVLRSPPLVVVRVYVVVEMSINALVPLLRIEQARLRLRLRVSFVFVESPVRLSVAGVGGGRQRAATGAVDGNDRSPHDTFVVWMLFCTGKSDGVGFHP